MLAAVRSEAEDSSESAETNQEPLENDTKRVMAELEEEARAADSADTQNLARSKTSEDKADDKVEAKTKLTSDQAKKITKGIVAKIQNPKKLNNEMKKEIGKQVQANLSKENIEHAKTEASEIMDKVQKEIDQKLEAKKTDDLKKLDAETTKKIKTKTEDLKKVLEVKKSEPAADTRTDLEVLGETPTPVTEKVEKATLEILKFIEIESSETCNQYITTLPKGDCMNSHSQLYSILAAKNLSPAEILNTSMKNKIDRVKQASWYFISEPYAAVENKKKLAGEEKVADDKKDKKEKKKSSKDKKNKKNKSEKKDGALIEPVDKKKGENLVLGEKAKKYLDDLWTAWQVKTVWEEEQKLMADFKKGKMEMAGKSDAGKKDDGKAAGDKKVKDGNEKKEKKK